MCYMTLLSTTSHDDLAQLNTELVRFSSIPPGMTSSVFEAQAENSVPRSTLLMIACWLLVAALFACAVSAVIGTAQFEQVFNSFGADMPPVAVLFLKGRYLWWLLLVSKNRRHAKGYQTKITIAFAALILFSVALVATAAFAMRLPPYKLANVTIEGYFPWR